MDLLMKMNAALDYIENNLTEEIDFTIVAKKLVVHPIIFSACFLLLQMCH